MLSVKGLIGSFSNSFNRPLNSEDFKTAFQNAIESGKLSDAKNTYENYILKTNDDSEKVLLEMLDWTCLFAENEDYFEIIDLLIAKVSTLDFTNDSDSTLLLSVLDSAHYKTNDLRKALLEKLLNKDANPNISNAMGCFPLDFVDDFDLVDLLLKYSANPNNYGQVSSPLETACKKQDLKTARLLIEAGAKNIPNANTNVTPLSLLQKMIGPEAEDLIGLLQKNENSNEIDNNNNRLAKEEILSQANYNLVCEDSSPQKTFFSSNPIELSEDTSKEKQKKEINPDSQSKFALLPPDLEEAPSLVNEFLKACSQSCDLTYIEENIDKMKNINSYFINKALFTTCGSANSSDHEKIVKLLLDNGANPNFKDEETGALPLTVLCNRITTAKHESECHILEMLLQRDANPNLYETCPEKINLPLSRDDADEFSITEGEVNEWLQSEGKDPKQITELVLLDNGQNRSAPLDCILNTTALKLLIDNGARAMDKKRREARNPEIQKANDKLFENIDIVYFD